MRSIAFNSVVLLFSFLTILCFAEEKEGAAHEGGKEAAADKTPKDRREYATKSAKVTSLGLRIEEANKRFSELVKEKEEAKSSAAKQEAIHEMVEVTKQRNKDVNEYNALKSELTYRYPNQGEDSGRQYKTHSQRTVEEMEAAGGLDQQLTFTKKLIDRKYAPFMGKEKNSLAKKSVQAEHQEEKSKPLRLEK